MGEFWHIRSRISSPDATTGRGDEANTTAASNGRGNKHQRRPQRRQQHHNARINSLV